ncbi:MAG: beta-propeller domain-containing protein [Anaeroplasma sp.]
MKYRKFKQKLREEYKNTFNEEKVEIKKKSVHKKLLPIYVLCSTIFLFAIFLTVNHISVSIYNRNLESELKNHYNNISIVGDLKKVNSQNDFEKYNSGYKQSLIDIFTDGIGESMLEETIISGADLEPAIPEGIPGSDITTPNASGPTQIDTNNQISGIDEADIAKCDGKFVYYLIKSKLYVYDLKGVLIASTDTIKGDMLVYEDKIIIIGREVIKIIEYKDNTLIEIYSSDNVMVDSRLIQNNLYLVTKNYSLNDINYDCCYYDEYSNVNCLFRIIKINLDTMEIISVDNANNGEAVLYMSNDYIVLATTIYPLYSFFHKVMTLSSVFDTDLNPIGTFKTNGTVLNQFSINVFNDILRIVCTDKTADACKLNSITLFDLITKEQLGYLDENIGEDRQIVKSVSFKNDKCFIVTYRNTDPLYEIDLSDPRNPKIVDCYKAPGYSSYLHNFSINDKDYILGLGLTDDFDFKISIYLDEEDNIQIGSDFIISPYDYNEVDLKQNSRYELFSNHKALFIFNDDINLYLGTNIEKERYVIFKIDINNFDNIVSVYMDIEVNSETRCFLVDGKLLIPNIANLIITDLYQ